jgi:uncharacterized protein YdeI (YjbR/CyaY-like superfamily)
MTVETPELLLKDRRAWTRWLAREGASSEGVWLVLAKKGVSVPTSLTYDEALDEALCQGWIDGQKGRRDDDTYRQRFTPRRPRSPWSQRNVRLAEQLISDGRMQPAGLAAIEKARADGRWDAAYAGQAAMEVPADLAAALQGNERAAAMFEILTGVNRYAICYRITSAKRPETRARRVADFVDQLARGQTPHPQRRTMAD